MRPLVRREALVRREGLVRRERPKHIRKHGSRHLSLLGLIFLLGMNGQLPFCNNEAVDPSQGNLHRLTDVVVVRPGVNDPSTRPTACQAIDPSCVLGNQGTLGGACRVASETTAGGACDLGLICDASDTCIEIPHTYVVTANPEIEQLRIYDAYDRDFVRAPNVFFPLSVRTGPATRRLAVPPGDDDVVYALDGADDTVRLIRTQADADTGAAPFTKIGTGFRTARAPGDIAVASLTETSKLVFVTLPDESSLQVFVVDETTGLATYAETEFAEGKIFLGEGSHPFAIASEPTHDAIVVTDAVLDSVAIVRTDTLVVDRRLDVGGPTAAVATGRADPGDGMGPMALIARRDASEVVALRLYRPNIREDRYAVLASAELPEAAAALFIPDPLRAGDTEPTVCCPGLSRPEEASLAWAITVSGAGKVRYLRFDGARSGFGSAENDADRRRGLLRLVDNDADEPGFAGGTNPDVASDVWFPADTLVGGRPSVSVTAIDNFGSPPRVPYWPVGYTISLTWEGSPAGGNERSGVLEGELLSFGVDGEGLDISERDVRAGDRVQVDTRDRPSSQCPANGSYTFTIQNVNANLVDVGGLANAELTCLLTGGSFTGRVFVAEAWTATSSRDGYLGRLRMDDLASPPADETRIFVPGIEIKIAASEAGLPAPGSQFVLPLEQNVEPLLIDLGQPFNSVTADGFGQLGLLPTGIAGGDAWIQPVAGVPREVRRLFISIGGNTRLTNGRLLELNETETSLARVNSDNL